MEEDNRLKKEIENKAKQAVKKKSKSLLLHGLRLALPYILGFLGILFAIIAVFIILNSVVDSVTEFFTNIGNEVDQWWEYMWNGTTEEENEALDKLILQIESGGASLNDLGILRTD